MKKSGARSWSFKWADGDKRPELGLGSYPEVTLSKAREIAADCRTAVATGRQPKTALRGRRLSDEAGVQKPHGDTSTTFGEAARARIAWKEPAWRNEKHIAQCKTTMGPLYCSSIAELPVGSVMMKDIVDILAPIWLAKPETASRLRGRLDSVFAYAIHKGWSASPNPAVWKEKLEFELLSQREIQRGHHASMAYQDIPNFWAELNGRSSVSAQALRLTIQAACRTSEVLEARWLEVDFDARVWTIPAERTKQGREHQVPLTHTMWEDLTALKAKNPLARDDGMQFLFPGQKEGRPLSNMSMSKVLKCAGYGDVTVHGFRSTFRNWCMEATPFAGDVGEISLGHRIGSHIKEVYRRAKGLELRRQLLTFWQSHLDGDEEINSDRALHAFLAARSNLVQQAHRVAI